jgi:sugar (pentulose or hexulose) kinase
MPLAYRDRRNSPAAMQRVFDIFGKRKLYDTTGIQFLPFNTVFQLCAENNEKTPLFELADRLLFMPDLINYALCGVKANEATIASTSGLIDLKTRDFSPSILSAIGVSGSLFSSPVSPGTVLGKITGLPGLDGVPVIAVMIRGDDYETEWASNFLAGFSGDMTGFSDADWEQFLSDLEAYGLSRYLEIHQSYLDAYYA